LDSGSDLTSFWNAGTKPDSICFLTQAIVFPKNNIALQKTLGVPCAEIYPLNLMQLVLPKGKVEANLLLSFRPAMGNLYSFSN
jgi:hypothetical protein